MKPIMLLLSASFVFAASGALAQGQGDACSPQYGSCMDRCTSRPQSLQESCSQMCEANTSQCYQGLYGRTPQDAQPSNQAASQATNQGSQEPEARAARDEVKPGDKPKRH